MPFQKRSDRIPHSLRYRGELASLHQPLEHLNLLPGQSDSYPIHHLNHSYLTSSGQESAICQTIAILVSDCIR